MGIEFPPLLEIDHHIPISDVRLSAPNVNSFVLSGRDILCPLSSGDFVYNHTKSPFERFVRHIVQLEISAAKPMTVFNFEIYAPVDATQ
jgi:hypothetical protein